MSDGQTIDELRRRIRELECRSVCEGLRYQALEEAFRGMAFSRCWRLTAPIRFFLDRIKRVCRAWKGGKTAKRTVLADRLRVTEERRKAEGDLVPTVRVSFLTPLYNTDAKILRETVGSLFAQTCGAWELCLADASDSAHAETSRLAQELAGRDARIRYRKLATNGGISANSNAAAELATGEVLAILDHDDLLHPSAVHRIVTAFVDGETDFFYSDEAVFADEAPHPVVHLNFKPDYAPDYLRGSNYICHLAAFRRGLLTRAGGLFRSAFDGSQDHDLFLRLTAVARKIVHVPEILYFWRACASSVASSVAVKPYAARAGIRAVEEDLRRRGWKGTVESLPEINPCLYRIRYAVDRTAKVSLVIPTRNHVKDLRRCIGSICANSTYRNYEIVVVDNGSDEPALAAYLKSLGGRPNIKVVRYDIPFNYSVLNNRAVREVATGDFVLLLNNDTTVITPSWIEEMLMFAQRPDVGCVGAKLYYRDDTVQHAGIVLGPGGAAGHIFICRSRQNPGECGRLRLVQNYQAVTAACLMVRREVFDKVGGLDEGYAVDFNDVDFCLRVRRAGYLNVWTPFAELYHDESKSRGRVDTPASLTRRRVELDRLLSVWAEWIAQGDPYYNARLKLAPFVFEEA